MTAPEDWNIGELFGAQDDPTQAEWDSIKDYRSRIEFAWQDTAAKEPAGWLSKYDAKAEGILRQLREDFLLDTRSLRTLWTMQVAASVQFYFVTIETLNQCRSTQAIKEHSLAHIQRGCLTLDFVLRTAILGAGGPTVEPQAPSAPVYDQDGEPDE